MMPRLPIVSAAALASGSVPATYVITGISTTVSRTSTSCAAPVVGCTSSLRRSAQA